MNKASEYLKSAESIEALEIGQLVDLVINDAIEAGSSDIHIEPWDASLIVRVRLNCVLQ